VPTVKQSVPTLAELRGDNRLLTNVNNQYEEFEAGHLGNVSTNKKARGLLRAGGESSRHLHIDWPHDFILAGPDKNHIFYKNLNLEQ
jgi:hypothetical protein